MNNNENATGPTPENDAGPAVKRSLNTKGAKKHKEHEEKGSDQHKDKFREDFKEDFEFLDWLEAHPEERVGKKILREADRDKNAPDPTVVNISAEEFEEWIKKYNLHNADEWIERLGNL